MAAPNPYQDIGAYLETFRQDPALYTEGADTEPYYTPDSQTSLYGTNDKGKPLYGPLIFQDYYPDPKHQPRVNISRKLTQDKPKLLALGFQFIAKIGSGAFGQVFRVRHTNTITGEVREFAGKILFAKTFFKKGKSIKTIISELLNDVTALRGLQHPSLVSIELVVHIRDEKTGFPSLFVMVCMELCDGCLTDVMKQSPNGCFNEQQAKEWFTQIANGLLYLHQHGVVHQDIKPANILYKRIPNTNVIHYKLADFGISKVFAPNQPMKSKDYGGTFLYMPPEGRHLANIFGCTQHEFDLKAMDVYSLAVSLAESLIGSYIGLSHIKLRSRTPGLDIDYYISDLLVRSGKLAADNPVIDLMSRMTESDPNQRLTMDQVLLHPWLDVPLQQL